MPRRRFVLATNETYHIYNRSVAKESIFSSATCLNKIIEISDYYRYHQELRLSKFKKLPVDQKKSYLDSIKNREKLVDIYSFAFMPNHYHFLLKQLVDNGIVNFISNFQNSFAKYFNIKNDRNGALFLNPFKGKRIESEDQFVHVSRYIHLNPVTSYLVEFKDLPDYPWTSFRIYHYGLNLFVNTKLILESFKSIKSYYNFVEDQVDYQRSLALIKDLVLE
ncbi:MAG: transposase [Candidatus Levybacteria bacterium]|nr:transposase [Candidatus Levybacteria bacterium]